MMGVDINKPIKKWNLQNSKILLENINKNLLSQVVQRLKSKDVVETEFIRSNKSGYMRSHILTKHIDLYHDIT